MLVWGKQILDCGDTNSKEETKTGSFVIYKCKRWNHDTKIKIELEDRGYHYLSSITDVESPEQVELVANASQKSCNCLSENIFVPEMHLGVKVERIETCCFHVTT